ncbi:MAG: GDP-mannose 4,6-dehydratase [Acidithiobacillus ferrivorans]
MRGTGFVTRKITLALARIRHGLQDVLELGHLDSQRDWGSVGDHVHADFDREWQGNDEKTQGIDRRSGKVIVRVNPAFYRPAEVDILIGDPSKANQQLGWKPEVPFDALVQRMAEADLRRAVG